MRHVEIELRKTGNPEDLKRADTVASWLKERGSDIPFPSVATPVETRIVNAPSDGRLNADVGLGVDYWDDCSGGSVVLVAPPLVVPASPKL